MTRKPAEAQRKKETKEEEEEEEEELVSESSMRTIENQWINGIW
jgi:hypothetical protein